MMKKIGSRHVMVVSLVLFVVALVLLYAQSQPEGSVLNLSSNSRGGGEMKIVSPDEVEMNVPFEVLLNIDTNGNPVNAAGIYLRYDPDILQLLNMDTSQSFCQFYPEKRFDQRLGTVSLACGSPHPGLEGKNTMIKMEFMPLKLGSTTIRSTEESRLLLSDGKGDNNILGEYPTKSVIILNTL